MAIEVKRRRGTTAEHAAFTGAVGELTVDSTKDTVVVHDGVLAGGYPLMREDLSNASSISAFAKTILDDTTASNMLTTLGVSAFIKTMLDDANAANVFGTLGISPFVQTLLDDTDASAFLTTLGLSSARVVGEVAAFAMGTVPSGWLECNGAAVSRATYATLYAAIGTAYGVGDGSTTFNIPDLRGEFVRGWDNARGVDAGRVLGSSQTEMIGPHTHLGGQSTTSWTGAAASGGDVGWNRIYNPAAVEANTGTENRPRNVALMYCIKY